MAEIGSISQKDTVKCTVPGPSRLLHVLDEAEPLERLPKAPPFRLHLIGGEDAIGIGADGEEGGVTEIEKAREADHDVEAERQDREGERVRGGVDIALIAVEERENSTPTTRKADDEGSASRDARGSIPYGGQEARPAAHGGRRGVSEG